MVCLARLGAATEMPVLDAELSVVTAILPSAQVRGLQEQIPGLTGGEGVLDANHLQRLHDFGLDVEVGEERAVRLNRGGGGQRCGCWCGLGLLDGSISHDWMFQFCIQVRRVVGTCGAARKRWPPARQRPARTELLTGGQARNRCGRANNSQPVYRSVPRSRAGRR